jgi:hypothetical protein
MAGLDQVRRHGMSHDSQPHKRNSHAAISFVAKNKPTLSD